MRIFLYLLSKICKSESSLLGIMKTVILWQSVGEISEWKVLCDQIIISFYRQVQGNMLYAIYTGTKRNLVQITSLLLNLPNQNKAEERAVNISWEGGAPQKARSQF